MTGDGTDTGQPEARYVLRLFITGSTPRSIRAIDNMRRICRDHLAGRYDLKVIDVYQDPEATRDLLIAQFTLDLTEPNYALGYAFDIVLRGRSATPMEA